MKVLFAIPTANGELTQHFGRCEKFAVVEVEDNAIVKEEYLTPPEHQPGSFPKFLAGKGVDVIIAGGMGPQAQNLFAENKIKVILGIDAETPSKLVEKYINLQLEAGENLCDENH